VISKCLEREANWWPVGHIKPKFVFCLVMTWFKLKRNVSPMDS
jgi:hypothetical protein